MQALVRGISCIVATRNHAIGDTLFRKKSPMMEYVNHSCKPNATLHHNNVVATHHIVMGTEITLNFTEIRFDTDSLNTVCMDCGSMLCGENTQCMQSNGSI